MTVSTKKDDEANWSKAEWDEYYGYNVDVVVTHNNVVVGGGGEDCYEREMTLKEKNNVINYNYAKSTNVVTPHSRRRNSIGVGAYKYNGPLPSSASSSGGSKSKRRHSMSYLSDDDDYYCTVDKNRGGGGDNVNEGGIAPTMWRRRRRSSNVSTNSSSRRRSSSSTHHDVNSSSLKCQPKEGGDESYESLNEKLNLMTMNPSLFCSRRSSLSSNGSRRGSIQSNSCFVEPSGTTCDDSNNRRSGFIRRGSRRRSSMNSRSGSERNMMAEGENGYIVRRGSLRASGSSPRSSSARNVIEGGEGGTMKRRNSCRPIPPGENSGSSSSSLQATGRIDSERNLVEGLGAMKRKTSSSNRRRMSIGNGAYKYEGPLPGSSSSDAATTSGGGGGAGGGGYRRQSFNKGDEDSYKKNEDSLGGADYLWF